MSKLKDVIDELVTANRIKGEADAVIGAPDLTRSIAHGRPSRAASGGRSGNRGESDAFRLGP